MLRRDVLKIESYFEGFLIIFLIMLFLFIIKSYVMTIFLAATLVFLIYKPYKKLAKKTRSDIAAALFMLFLVIVLIFVPLYWLSLALIGQTTDLISSGNKLVRNIDWDDCTFDFCGTIRNNIHHLDLRFETVLGKVVQFLGNSLSSIFSSVSYFVVNIAVFILAFFFLLKDGDKFMKYVKKIIPMKDEYKDALFLRFREVSLTVFVGDILIAIMQGSLLGLGFYIVGIQSPIFWGTVASFFALVPMVGTSLIWIPAVVYLILIESYVGALILTGYSLTIVGLSDNFVRMLMLNRKTNVHPFLILISIMGGIEVFGFFGVFIGPIIVSLLVTVLQLYNLDFDY